MKIIKNSINEEENIQIKVEKDQLTTQHKEFTISTRIIKDTFPDFNSVIPDNNKTEAEIDTQSLISCLKRVSIFSNRTTRQIALTFDDNKVIITTEDPENITSGHEEIICEYKEEPLTIGFNANYLKEMLTHQSTEDVYIKLKSSLGAGMIIPKEEKSDREILSLLMPIRI